MTFGELSRLAVRMNAIDRSLPITVIHKFKTTTLEDQLEASKFLRILLNTCTNQSSGKHQNSESARHNSPDHQKLNESMLLNWFWILKMWSVKIRNRKRVNCLSEGEDWPAFYGSVKMSIEVEEFHLKFTENLLFIADWLSQSTSQPASTDKQWHSSGSVFFQKKGKNNVCIS